MNRKPSQKYSKEFKIEAVRLAEQSDKPVTQIARELGIRQNQIYKWKKQLEIKGKAAFPGTGQISDADGELAKLRRDLHACDGQGYRCGEEPAGFAVVGIGHDGWRVSRDGRGWGWAGF